MTNTELHTKVNAKTWATEGIHEVRLANRWAKFGLGITISVVSLWWALKDAKLAETWLAVASANWVVTLFLYFWILAAIHILRTLRWGNLLSGMEKIPFKQINEASAIGFMMLVVLPFRLGEFARPFLIAQRSHIRRSAAMTTVVLERITDVLFIALLLQGLMYFLPQSAPNYGVIRSAANVMFLISMGGFLFLLLARWKHHFVAALIHRVFGFLGPARADNIVGVVDGFVGALKQLPDRKNMAFFIIWTTLYWGISGVGMMVFAHAFDTLQINLYQSYFMLCVVVIGMLIPAGPAGAGTTQAALLIGMSVFLTDDVINSAGVAYAIALWVVQVAQQIVVGLFYLVRSHSSFSDIAGKLSKQQTDV